MGAPPTSDQLKHLIDTGKTGDKVDHPDPGAAPLGTDEEAGGNSPSPAQIEKAIREETGNSGKADDSQ